jgi:hypothetical protein
MLHVQNCHAWESMGRCSKRCLNLGHYAQHKQQELSPDSAKLYRAMPGLCEMTLLAVATIIKRGGLRA